MNMKAFILFLLILLVFEITKKWNLTSYDLIGILAIACKIWTDCTKKLKFWNFSLFEEVNIWREIFAFEIFHFTKNFYPIFPHEKRLLSKIHNRKGISEFPYPWLKKYCLLSLELVKLGNVGQIFEGDKFNKRICRQQILIVFIDLHHVKVHLLQKCSHFS